MKGITDVISYYAAVVLSEIRSLPLSLSLLVRKAREKMICRKSRFFSL